MSEYERRHKEVMPVIAICYDFDKTLSPDDMQSQGYIQSVGWDVPKFWKKSNGMAQTNGMDQNLAYMYMMSKEGEGKVWLTKSGNCILANNGSRIPEKDLRKLMRAIEVNFFYIVSEWKNFYGTENTKFYC